MFQSFWIWKTDICFPNSYALYDHAKGRRASQRKRTKMNYKKLVSDEDENKNILKKLQRMWKLSVDCTYPQQWYLHIWQEILMLIISLALRTVTFLIWFLKICQTRTMHYWKGLSNTSGDLSSPKEPENVNLRFLTLEQEFLLTMMRSRLGLLAGDLANRFKVSNSLVSSVFTTWVRLMSLELRWLIN